MLNLFILSGTATLVVAFICTSRSPITKIIATIIGIILLILLIPSMII